MASVDKGHDCHHDWMVSFLYELLQESQEKTVAGNLPVLAVLLVPRVEVVLHSELRRVMRVVWVRQISRGKRANSRQKLKSHQHSNP